MSVAPNRLDGIAADHFKRPKLEGCRLQGKFRPATDVAEDVSFTGAVGTGTVAAELLQFDVAFRSTVPCNGQFVADDLNVGGLHGYFRIPV